MNSTLSGLGSNKLNVPKTIKPLLNEQTFWKGFSLGMAVDGAKDIVDGYDDYEPNKAAHGLKKLAFASKAIPGLSSAGQAASTVGGCGLWGGLAFHEMAKGQRDQVPERKAWGLGGVLCATGFMLKGIGASNATLGTVGTVLGVAGAGLWTLEGLRKISDNRHSGWKPGQHTGLTMTAMGLGLGASACGCYITGMALVWGGLGSQYLYENSAKYETAINQKLELPGVLDKMSNSKPLQGFLVRERAQLEAGFERFEKPIQRTDRLLCRGAEVVDTGIRSGLKALGYQKTMAKP